MDWNRDKEQIYHIGNRFVDECAIIVKLVIVYLYRDFRNDLNESQKQKAWQKMVVQADKADDWA